VRYERLSREVRLQVVALLDSGKDPAVVAKELRIPVAAVYGAKGWAAHMRAHQHAAKSLREQLAQLAPVEAPQPAVATPAVVEEQTESRAVGTVEPEAPSESLECTVVRSLSGPCSACRKYTDGLHVVDEPDGPPKVFCASCCVVCNSQNQGTANSRSAEVVP
jgi:hypothetical protein